MLRRLTRCSSLCGESKLKAFCFQWRVPAAPREAGALRGGADAPSSALLPMGGPTRPTPGVPFVSRRKEPKACRGCAPGPCQCKTSALIGAALPLAPGLLSTTNPDRFATLGWWANRSLFLPKLYRGSHPQLSIRGAAVLASGMLEGLSYRNQYR